MKLSHSPAVIIPIVKQLWLEFFLLKLAHFFISEVAQFFIDKGTQVFIHNRTLDFTNAEDIFLSFYKKAAIESNTYQIFLQTYLTGSSICRIMNIG